VAVAGVRLVRLRLQLEGPVVLPRGVAVEVVVEAPFLARAAHLGSAAQEARVAHRPHLEARVLNHAGEAVVQVFRP
jgi:hypothetical protein